MSSRKEGSYVNVSIPIEIVREIDRVIRSGTGGYKSRAEFIKDAARRQLESIALRK